jgi:hypothetical protein
MSMKNDTKGIIIILTGLMIAFFFFISGASMLGIQSISGDTIAEAFYNDMGSFVIALSFLVVWLSVMFYFMITKKQE